MATPATIEATPTLELVQVAVMVTSEVLPLLKNKVAVNFCMPYCAKAGGSTGVNHKYNYNNITPVQDLILINMQNHCIFRRKMP